MAAWISQPDIAWQGKGGQKLWSDYLRVDRVKIGDMAGAFHVLADSILWVYSRQEANPDLCDFRL